MALTTPMLQLKMQPNYLKALLRYYQQGATPPPSWFDSPALLDKYIWPHVSGMIGKQNLLETQLQYGLYNFLESFKTIQDKPKKFLGYPARLTAPALKPFFKPKKCLDFSKYLVEFNLTDVAQLHELVKLMVKNNSQGLEVLLTPEQFAKLYPNAPQLMHLHGNQTLTGAPYIIGGLQHVDFFQWGNLMGIVKFQELPGEKMNYLIHFEDLEDMKLEERYAEYQKHELQLVESIKPEPIYTPSESLISTPRLTLTPPITTGEREK